MQLALFGATGGTGLELLKRLQGQPGTKVRCLVRDPAKLPEGVKGAEGVELVQGSATEAADVTKTVESADVVIVSLGGPPKGPGVDICSKAQALINEAVNKSKPDAHVICISSIGVGDHYQHCGLFAKFFASWIIPEALADKDKQEQMCREQLKNWTIVRPGGLIDKPAKGVWRAAPDVCGFYPTIPRADVADFVVKECMPPANKWLHQSVALVT